MFRSRRDGLRSACPASIDCLTGGRCFGAVSSSTVLGPGGRDVPSPAAPAPGPARMDCRSAFAEHFRRARFRPAGPRPTKRVFASDAGMVLNFIKPTRPPTSRRSLAKLKEALQKSEKPERKQQAASWKVFKSPEPAAGGNALYVFVIDPAVKDADYTVSNILAESFPPAS